jgi:hypothetical protein
MKLTSNGETDMIRTEKKKKKKKKKRKGPDFEKVICESEHERNMFGNSNDPI